MIPDPITIGHVLMLAALLLGLYGLWQVVVWVRHRDYGRGTPQYARGRDGRRFALRSIAASVLLFAAGCFTPLSQMAIG